MSVWDIAVIVVFVLCLAAIGFVVFSVLKLKNGPVTHFIGRSRTLIGSGKTLVETGSQVFAANKLPVTGLIRHMQQISDDIRFESSHSAFANEPVNFARIAALLTTAKTVRGGFQTLTKFRARKSVAFSAAKSQTARPSLAEKLGLLPPAAKHFAPAMRVARIALETHRQLRSRGIL